MHARCMFLTDVDDRKIHADQTLIAFAVVEALPGIFHSSRRIKKGYSFKLRLVDM